jgi:hypothetical protein
VCAADGWAMCAAGASTSWGQLGYPGAPGHIAVPAAAGNVSIAYGGS